MSPAWQITLGMLGPVLLLAGVVVTARVTRQGGREATRSADWASFAAEVREWTEDRLAERDQRINSLATELAEVRSELGIVRSELDELAKKYSSDTGSNANGGLYTNVAKGNMVPEFDAWIYDESRKVGDTDIIFVDEEGYYTGYHVMYFCGSHLLWEEYAKEDYASTKANEIIILGTLCIVSAFSLSCS